MTNRELSNFDGEDLSNTISNPNIHLSSIEMELADRINVFRLSLENDRNADAMSHCFTFKPESLSDIFLPQQVKQLETRHGTLSSVNIETHFLNKSSGISYELRMEFVDSNNISTWLTAFRPYNDSNQDVHHDVISLIGTNFFIDGKQMYEIDAFTPQEFNRCLGSIVYSSPLINQSVFDFYDWHHDNYSMMTDNFSCIADKSWSHYEYFLTDRQGGHSGLLSYFKINDDVSEIRLSRMVQHEASIFGNHMKYYEKTIEMSLPMSQNSQIELFEHSIRDQETHTQVCIPLERDYYAALEFVDEQIRDIKNIQIERFSDETTQPLDD